MIKSTTAMTLLILPIIVLNPLLEQVVQGIKRYFSLQFQAGVCTCRLVTETRIWDRQLYFIHSK